jgi:hypothetical protein
MNRFQDDVQQGLAACRQVLDGLTGLGRVAASAATKLDEPLFGRVIEACLGAALGTAPIAAHDSAASETSVQGRLALTCSVHGPQLWRGTIVCQACNEVFQLFDYRAPRYAPSRCDCGEQLLPASAPYPTSAAPMCTICFVETLAERGQAEK